MKTPIGAVLLSALMGTATAESSAAVPPVPPPPAGFESRHPLDPDDYRRKNERGYLTALPLANYDPNTGYGFGARVYYFWDGTRADPRFAYTPYLQRMFLNVFATTGGLQFHWFDYDVPSVAGTPIRFRAQLIYTRNTDEHYFGIGSQTLGPLSFPGSSVRYGSYSQYQQALDGVTPGGVTWSRYNRYDVSRPILVAGFERSLFHGIARPLIGVGLNHVSLRSYGGSVESRVGANGEPVEAVNAPTRLDQDCASRVITGCAGGWDNFLRLGFSIDTRDFEPDPNHGVFIDLALDLGSHALGSDYDWRRFMLAARGYVSLLPAHADLVLAVRGTFEDESATTPFFEMKVFPYTDDPHDGMGGLRTLRGYRQDRFVGPVMLLGNAELRWTFGHCILWKQKLALIAVPFVDTGSVADRLSDVRLSGWRSGEGGALRVSWNLATIVTVEYGRSSEDSGLYVNFNHMF
jgi:Omp85 superfamily domain